jgi:hypothetical protein
MSVFTALPQDMLQWEISRFLNPLSRAEFNCVLQPDERVYKKLPADYALAHQIRTVHGAYQKLAMKVNVRMEMAGDDARGRKSAAFAVIYLRSFFAFFEDPMNALAVMYQNNLKASLLRSLATWGDDNDTDLYDFITEDEKDEIKENALKAISVIEAIPFVRHIKAIKSVF